MVTTVICLKEELQIIDALATEWTIVSLLTPLPNTVKCGELTSRQKTLEKVCAKNSQEIPISMTSKHSTLWILMDLVVLALARFTLCSRAEVTLPPIRRSMIWLISLIKQEPEPFLSDSLRMRWPLRVQSDIATEKPIK